MAQVIYDVGTADAEDAMADDTSTWSNTTIETTLGDYDGYPNRRNFWRWQITAADIDGATIDSAYIKIYCYDDDFAAQEDFEFKLIDEDSCAAFTTNPHGRSVTTNYIAFDGGGFASASWWTSPDVSLLVQEFIDRSGFAQNNYIGIRAHQTGGRKVREGWCYSSNYSSGAYAAQLEINYTPPVTTPPTSVGGGAAYGGAFHY